jgi:hypothetical protein
LENLQTLAGESPHTLGESLPLHWRISTPSWGISNPLLENLHTPLENLQLIIGESPQLVGESPTPFWRISTSPWRISKPLLENPHQDILYITCRYHIHFLIITWMEQMAS